MAPSFPTAYPPLAALWFTGRAIASECENEIWAIINANKNNETALNSIHAPPWVSASEFRGTMAILQSCVLTLVACIYTALHLNVPGKSGFLALLTTKVKWVLMALLAPEVVLYTAARQYHQARKLCKSLRELQEQCKDVNNRVSLPPCGLSKLREIDSLIN